MAACSATGGCWAKNLNVAASESPYLAFIVGLHVATALALLVYFRRDWIRIIQGFFAYVRKHDGAPIPLIDSRMYSALAGATLNVAQSTAVGTSTSPLPIQPKSWSIPSAGSAM